MLSKIVTNRRLNSSVLVLVVSAMLGCNSLPTGSSQLTDSDAPAPEPVAQPLPQPGLIHGTEVVAAYDEAAAAIDKVAGSAVMQRKFHEMEAMGYAYSPENALRMGGNAITPEDGDTVGVEITILPMAWDEDTTRACYIAHVEMDGRGSIVEAAIFSTVDPGEEEFEYIAIDESRGLWLRSFGAESSWERATPRAAGVAELDEKEWWECTWRGAVAGCYAGFGGCIFAGWFYVQCVIANCVASFIASGIDCYTRLDR